MDDICGTNGCTATVTWHEYDSDDDVYLGLCDENHAVHRTNDDEVWKE